MNNLIKSYVLALLFAVFHLTTQTLGQAAPGPVDHCNLTTVKPNLPPVTYSLLPCVLAKFSAFIEVGQGQYIKLENGTVNVPQSICNSTASPDMEKIVITFNCATLSFGIKHNGSMIYVAEIDGSYNTSQNNQTTFINNTQLFSVVESGHYYKCDSEQSVILPASQAGAQNAKLVLHNFAYEAFRANNGTNFFKIPEQCALDSGPVSDWVRIGVGISLIALVAIVLVAYFVGRRRWSQRSSYESV